MSVEITYGYIGVRDGVCLASYSQRTGTFPLHCASLLSSGDLDVSIRYGTFLLGDSYALHYFNADALVFACMAHIDVPQDAAFSFLNELYMQFFTVVDRQSSKIEAKMAEEKEMRVRQRRTSQVVVGSSNVISAAAAAAAAAATTSKKNISQTSSSLHLLSSSTTSARAKTSTNAAAAAAAAFALASIDIESRFLSCLPMELNITLQPRIYLLMHKYARLLLSNIPLPPVDTGSGEHRLPVTLDIADLEARLSTPFLVSGLIQFTPVNIQAIVDMEMEARASRKGRGAGEGRGDGRRRATTSTTTTATLFANNNTYYNKHLHNNNHLNNINKNNKLRISSSLASTNANLTVLSTHASSPPTFLARHPYCMIMFCSCFCCLVLAYSIISIVCGAYFEYCFNT